MPKISIEQIRSANQKLIAGKACDSKPYSAKFSQNDINEMLRKAFHSIPQ